jgi:hypothetical protein
MIDKSKTYRTRDGREVRIYATDGVGRYSVHGAIREDDGWRNAVWTEIGKAGLCDDVDYANDLVEVRPRIKREVWVNVYPDPAVCGAGSTKKYADEWAAKNRIACVKLTIDCEEGEGLE